MCKYVSTFVRHLNNNINIILPLGTFFVGFSFALPIEGLQTFLMFRQVHKNILYMLSG